MQIRLDKHTNFSFVKAEAGLNIIINLWGSRKDIFRRLKFMNKFYHNYNAIIINHFMRLENH